MIDSAPLLLVGTVLLALMMVAYESGMRLHRRLRSRADAPGNESSDESYAMSGVFGLLALLMAFAFGLALDRFEERRVLVVAEANAIGTFASRLALAPAAAQAMLQRDLVRYAKARTVVGRTTDAARSQVAANIADALHVRLGEQLMLTLAAGPGDSRTSLLVQAFDETGDTAAQRRAARAARLPDLVLALLALYCFAGAGMLGYTVAGSGARHRIAAGVFFLLLSFAFVTILDLDRPRGGAITVSQSELERVTAQLTNETF